MPQSVHSHMTRKMREATNHNMIKSVAEVRREHELQREYLKKYYKLPHFLQVIHENKMFESVQAMQELANTLFPLENEMREKDSMFTMHDQYSHIIEKIAINLRSQIKKRDRH